jgi:ABC-type multidrug transport system ATPase subunit
VALDIQNVRKVYRSDVLKGPQVAIDNLSLKFLGGRCTGLLGHNGAGKTTTIRMALGLVKPDEGKVLFEGRPLSTGEKRFIGYMPEVNKLPAALTPHEVLHHHLKLFKPEGLRTRAERKAEVDRKLEEVGLTAHRKRRIGVLSKGMARRLAWAQATIHKPRLLILDEPSSGLDPLARRQMLGWIEAEKERGTSILLCTHELQQVSTLCDDFHVLKNGRLVLTSRKTEELRPDGVAGYEWGHRYNIHVSGMDEPGLARFGKDGGLGAWQGFKQEGFLAVLGFADYAQSTAWLGALLQGGMVVLRFGDESVLDEEQLMRYFEGDH